MSESKDDSDRDTEIFRAIGEMLDMEEAKDAEPMLIISDDEDEPQSAIVPVKRRRSMDDEHQPTKMAKYPDADIVASLQGQIELMKSQRELQFAAITDMQVQLNLLMERQSGQSKKMIKPGPDSEGRSVTALQEKVKQLQNENEGLRAQVNREAGPSKSDELSRAIKESHTQLQSSMERIEQCINAAQATPKPETVNKAEISHMLNECMVQLKEQINQSVRNEDSKMQFERLSNDLESIKNMIAADRVEETESEEKSNSSEPFESVLDELIGDSPRLPGDSPSGNNLHINGRFKYPHDEVKAALDLRHQNPDSSFETYYQTVCDTIMKREFPRTTLRGWLKRDLDSRQHEQNGVKQVKDESAHKTTKSGRRSIPPAQIEMSIKKVEAKIDETKQTDSENTEKTTPGRGKRKRSEKIPDAQFGAIVQITFDHNQHPKELVVEAPSDNGFMQFKYQRHQMYYSKSTQVYSYYMNCCTDKAITCTARIVVSELYDESRVVWYEKPELRKTLATEDYQILKVRELHSAVCYEDALKIAEKD